MHTSTINGSMAFHLQQTIYQHRWVVYLVISLTYTLPKVIVYKTPSAFYQYTISLQKGQKIQNSVILNKFRRVIST